MDTSINAIEYNINTINKRLHLNKISAHQHINKRYKEMHDMLYSIIAISEFESGIIQIILSFSFVFVINKWHDVCDKLGPFSYLITSKKGCTTNEIDQFEQKVIEKCKLANYKIPSHVRAWLMICEAIQIPVIFDNFDAYWSSNWISPAHPENAILPINSWRFCDETELIDQLAEPYLDDVDNYSAGWKFVEGFEGKDWCEIRQYLVIIGEYNYNYGECVIIIFLNTLTNKVVTTWGHAPLAMEWFDEDSHEFEDGLWRLKDMKDYNSLNIELRDTDDIDDEYFGDIGKLSRYLCMKFFRWRQDLLDDDEQLKDAKYINVMNSYSEYYVSQIYLNKYKPLVIGFVRRIHPTLSVNVAIKITQNILTYFPFFMDP